MEAITEHLKEYYRWYLLGAVCVLPAIIIFRRHVIPAIFYAVELAIYMALLHGATHLVVLLAGWFKDQSTMKRAQGLLGQDFNPGWTTPLLEFWKRNEYQPQWLFYFEIVLVLLLISLMWRYRRPRMRRPRKKTIAPKKKPGYDYRKEK